MSTSSIHMAPEDVIAKYEPVIGLEVHVQLATHTKIFCGCATSFGAPPNTNVCPVCLGMPVSSARAQPPGGGTGDRGCAGAELHRQSAIGVRAQKTIFYPDLPKGYQISQYDQPLAELGYVDIEVRRGAPKRIGITRVHMEDERRQEHPRWIQRFRPLHLRGPEPVPGTPLIEIVSEPDIRSATKPTPILRS